MIHLTSALAPGHLGELHAYEQLLVLLLAFGPFLALAVVVYVVRRRDIAAEADEAGWVGWVGEADAAAGADGAAGDPVRRGSEDQEPSGS